MTPETNGESTPGLFTKRTLSNMASNVAPLLILIAFIGLFLMVSPWRFDAWTVALSLFLTVFPLVVLAGITLIMRGKLAEHEESDEDVLPP